MHLLKQQLLKVVLITAALFVGITTAMTSSAQAAGFDEFSEFSEPSVTYRIYEPNGYFGLYGTTIVTSSISGDGVVRAYVSTQSRVQYSDDSGANYVSIGKSGVKNTVAVSNDGSKVIIGYTGLSTMFWDKRVSVTDKDYNGLEISEDYGNTWRQIAPPEANRFWQKLTISNDGLKIAGVVMNNLGEYGSQTTYDVVTSNDGGDTWNWGPSRSENAIDSNAQLVASATGEKIAWVTTTGNLMRSSNYGTTWVDTGIKANAVAMSSDGSKILAGGSGLLSSGTGSSTFYSNLYTSTDGGTTFTSQNFFQKYYRPSGNKIHFLAISDDGKTQIVFTDPGWGVEGLPSHLFYSRNSGTTFSESNYYPFNSNLGSSQSVGVLLSSAGNILILNNGGGLAVSNLPVPDAIPAIRASVGNTTATISWDLPSSGPALTDYVLQYRISGNNPWQTVSHTASSTETSKTISGLVNGVSYLFRVSGKNENGYGNFAWTPTPLTLGFVSRKPESFLAAPGDGLIVVSWSAPRWDGDSPIRSYKVEYATNFSGPWTLHTSSTITGLTNGTPYFVRVTPVNDVGDGYPALTYSNAAVTPRTFPGKSSTPIATYSGSVINLVWTAVSSNGGSAITDYAYEYSSNGGDTVSTFTHTANTSTNVNLSGLQVGVVYVLRVKAYNAAGSANWSDWSNPVAITGDRKSVV